jgi:hypothetical protein
VDDDTIGIIDSRADALAGLFWGLSYQRKDLTEATISLRHYGKTVARIADRLARVYEQPTGANNANEDDVISFTPPGGTGTVTGMCFAVLKKA